MRERSCRLLTRCLVLIISAGCASAPAEPRRVPTATPPARQATTNNAVAPPAAPVRGYTGFTISMSFTMSAAGKDDRADYPEIDAVASGSPADKAGLKTGDVILEANGVDARTWGALFPVVGVKQVMRIRRGTEEREVVLVPVALPSPGTGVRP